MNKLRFTMTDFFGRIVLSSRFVAGMMLFFVLNFSAFFKMQEYLLAMKYTVSAFEFVTLYMASFSSNIIFYAVYIFQISSIPEWDGTRNSIFRFGKVKWYFSQIFQCLLIFLIQYMILFLSIWLALMPVMNFDNGWSEFVHSAKVDVLIVIQSNLNLTMNFQSNIIDIGSPGFVSGLNFGLNLLFAVFLSTIVVSLNINRKRGFGTIVGMFLLFIRITVQELPSQFMAFLQDKIELGRLVNTIRHGLIPTFLNSIIDVQNLDGYFMEWNLKRKIFYASAYFLVLTFLAVMIGIRKIKKTDLS